MAQASVPSNLTATDFFEIKESIRSYLRTRNEFTDYDFDGSAASYLLDILAYNTYYLAFNANMALNEAFLETASVRDNIVKIAKQLNYTPKSVKAPKACVRFDVQTALDGDRYPTFVTIKQGDVFISSNNFGTYTFALLNDVVSAVDQQTGIASFEKVVIYQGNLLEYSYVVTDPNKFLYLIPSENVDTELLRITISPNVQSTQSDEYSLANNITTLDGTSRIYFLEETDDLRYNVIFGDGIIGRKLISGELIQLKYLRTEGASANGCVKFNYIGVITDNLGRAIAPNSVTMATVDASQDGEERESIESIKYRASRAFTTQNRAVTETDYEYITSQIYPQAVSVRAFGGEKLSPPIYGKVFISIRNKGGTRLNETTKKRIKNSLEKYAIASIQAEIIDPRSFYILPNVYPFYDSNKTTLDNSGLRTRALDTLNTFNENESSNRFGGRLDSSTLTGIVNNIDSSINGTTVQLRLGQNLDQFEFGTTFSQCINFNNSIVNAGDYSGTSDGGSCSPRFSTVKSGIFYSEDYTSAALDNFVNLSASDLTQEFVVANSQFQLPVYVRDDGRGNLVLATISDENEIILSSNVGSVNYSTGEVCVGPLKVTSTPDGSPRLPIVVLPSGGGIDIPRDVDPTLFNSNVTPVDYTLTDFKVPVFDPNNFDAFNYQTGGINIIDIPTTTFEYPEIDTCF